MIPFRHAGLALATGMGACLNAGLLYYKLRQQAIYSPQPGWLMFVLKIATAIGAMSISLWLVAGADEIWLSAHAHTKVLRLTGVVALGGIVYFAALWVLGFRLRDFVQRGA
jgi:putative peptidoglycan lipid II flippase